MRQWGGAEDAGDSLVRMLTVPRPAGGDGPDIPAVAQPHRQPPGIGTRIPPVRDSTRQSDRRGTSAYNFGHLAKVSMDRRDAGHASPGNAFRGLEPALFNPLPLRLLGLERSLATRVEHDTRKRNVG